MLRVGWGRCLRKAISRWYLEQEADKLAYQVVKYQQRDRWSHGDLLRLAHPKAPSAEHDAVFRWILSGAEGLGEPTVKRKVNGEDRVATYAAAGKLPAIVEAFDKAKKASSKAEIVTLINDCDLPRGAIPTQWLNELEVWDALLQRMPLTALVWNDASRPPLSARSLQFFTDCSLPGLKKSSDQFALTAYGHAGKSLEPLSTRNLRLCGQPVSEQPKLINRNVAALDALQPVRP